MTSLLAGFTDGRDHEAFHTIWTAASDKQYHFRTYENSQIRMVDLIKMNLDAKASVAISMKGGVIKSLIPSMAN